MEFFYLETIKPIQAYVLILIVFLDQKCSGITAMLTQWQPVKHIKVL